MKCPICSADVMDGFSFCPKCGNEMNFEAPAEPATGNAGAAGTASSDTETAPFDEGNAQSVIYNGNTPDFSAPASPSVPTEPESLAPIVTNTAVRPGSVYLHEENLSSDITSVPSGVRTAPAPTEPVSVTPAAVKAAPAPSVPAAPAAVTPVPAAPVSARTPAVEQRDVSYGQPPVKPTAKGETNPVLSKEYRPLSTAGVFWYFILTCIPVIGFIVLLSFAFGGKNRSKKSLSRAILIGWLIFVILTCISFVIGFIFFQDKLVNLFNMDNWVSLGNYFAETFLNL